MNIKTIIRRGVLIIIGIILGINIYLSNANGLTNNKLPMPFGIGLAIVESGSMEPVYYKNDLIIVKKTDDVNIGDVVVYQEKNDLIVHRVIDINNTTITTQGDANTVSDTPFEKENIKGVVTACIPKAGIVVNALRTPVGIVVILIAAIVLIEISFRNKKNSDEKNIEEIKAEIKRLKEERANDKK